MILTDHGAYIVGDVLAVATKLHDVHLFNFESDEKVGLLFAHIFSLSAYKFYFVIAKNLKRTN